MRKFLTALHDVVGKLRLAVAEKLLETARWDRDVQAAGYQVWVAIRLVIAGEFLRAALWVVNKVETDEEVIITKGIQRIFVELLKHRPAGHR